MTLKFVVMSDLHDQPAAPFRRLSGPGQVGVEVGTDDRTSVLFQAFIDANLEIALPA